MTENEEATQQESGEETTAIEEETTAIEEQPAAEEQSTPEPVAEKAKPAAKSKTAAKKTDSSKKGAAIDDIMAAIKNMTVLDLADLVKSLETEFGVSAAATVVAAGPAEGAAPAEEQEEQTEFTVTLKEIGANKISVIRAVRELTSLGLKESKDLVEAAPTPVKESINKDEAAAAKAKLEEAGATADIT